MIPIKDKGYAIELEADVTGTTPEQKAPPTRRSKPDMTYAKHLPRGSFVAIGGAEEKTSDSEIMQRLFGMMKPDNLKVGVLTIASQIPDEVFPPYKALFENLGASEVVQIDARSREDAHDRKKAELMKSCGMVFISGGDQLRLTHVLGSTPLLDALRERLSQDAVVAGTSAGAAAMSGTMIYNGAASDALKKGAVNMSAGLGFVQGVVIDSHFLERGRFTRLMEVGATNPEFIGVGIGEDAAVIIHPGPILEAIGRGHVIIVDSTRMGICNLTDLADGEPLAVENVVMHALTTGYGYDVKKRKFLDEKTEFAPVAKVPAK